MRNYDHVQWRNSGLMPRLGLLVVSIDARATLPIILVLFHISWTTFYIFLGAVILFSVLEFYGYTFSVATRRLRALIAGRYRFVQHPISKRRRFIHG